MSEVERFLGNEMVISKGPQFGFISYNQVLLSTKVKSIGTAGIELVVPVKVVMEDWMS